MPLQVYHPTQEIGRAFYGDYDWQHTGFEPYVPDTQDYRRAANIEEANKKNTSELIEIPISAGSDKLITLIENWTLALRRRQWPRQRIGQSYTSLKITFAPWLFRRLWQGFLPQLENLREPFVHTYFHPDETLPITGRQAWMYSSKNAQSNFQTILKTCRAKGWATKFVTAQEYTRAISPQLGLIPADFKKIESAQGES